MPTWPLFAAATAGLAAARSWGAVEGGKAPTGAHGLLVLMDLDDVAMLVDVTQVCCNAVILCRSR